MQEDMNHINLRYLTYPMYVPTRQHFPQDLKIFSIQENRTADQYIENDYVCHRQRRLDLFQWHKWFK